MNATPAVSEPSGSSGAAAQPDALSREAVTMLTYLLGRRPPPILADRAWRGFAGSSQASLDFPAIVHSHPWMLRFLEAPLKPRSPRQQLLRQRLDMATVLCETSPEGQRLLWRGARQSRIGVLAGLFGELVLDALAMPVRLVASLAWK